MDSLITSTIKKHGIHLCNYNEFTDVVVIGEGGYGKIEKACWKRRGLKVALKSLKIGYEEGIVKAFIKEHYHPNINQFHGVAKDDEKAFEILRHMISREPESQDIIETPLCESPTTSVSHESRIDSYEEPKEYLLKQEKFDLISKWIDHF
ncbi:35805_t:CDS:2 [Gigaspora margarita]|uniref:35805_t:CDS:1 n=1 Tax=Gigaspora margarita TaxID=4874 RepID=A0ABN7UY62_GIGMA|nr:35805_t:CDS:2 [Gigaspora margarita]